MTDREKAIVMAYTGVCMLSGDKFKIFHEYIENIMDRPVYTHELADRSVENEIKEKAKADFIALCEEQEPILDKIRAEIKPTRKMYFEMNDVDWVNGCDYVLSVIDKYKAESEDKEC